MLIKDVILQTVNITKGLKPAVSTLTVQPQMTEQQWHMLLLMYWKMSHLSTPTCSSLLCYLLYYIALGDVSPSTGPVCKSPTARAALPHSLFLIISTLLPSACAHGGQLPQIILHNNTLGLHNSPALDRKAVKGTSIKITGIFLHCQRAESDDLVMHVALYTTKK